MVYTKYPSIYVDTFHSICRFDVEKECAKIDENVAENDPPAIINKGHPEIKTTVDTSCNVFRIMHLVYHLYS